MSLFLRCQKIHQGWLCLARATYLDRFFVGRFFRFVLANSLSCFLLIDLAICLDAPLSEDFFVSPRLAARAAPAAICCFFDLAGILDHRGRSGGCACRSTNMRMRSPAGVDRAKYNCHDESGTPAGLKR
jgi:hypothetical protein